MLESPIALQNEHIRLRPLLKSDYETIFEWHSDLRSLHLWWDDREILPYEAFVEDFQRRLRRHIDTLFLIENKETKALIGMVYSYNTSLIDKYTYLCIYLIPEATQQGIGAVAGQMFGNYLYAQYGFRKVYAEVMAFNSPSLKICQRNGFTEEARLKEHRWFNGKYWDQIILSIQLEEAIKNI